MEKINRLFWKMSLKKSLLIMLSIVFFVVIVLSTVTIWGTSNMQQAILGTRSIRIYTNEETPYQLADNYSYQLNVDEFSYEKLSGKNQVYYYIVTFLMAALPMTYIILGAVCAARWYYRVKLYIPIKALKKGIQHISDCDLDFEMSYDSGDELGTLCHAFESMRTELYRTNQKMWNLVREKKELVASVSHDLRTPITVIKGYLEYLQKMMDKGCDLDETLIVTVKGMIQSTERLERYVDCIQHIQKMEEVEIIKSNINFADFIQQMRREFVLLAAKQGKKLEVYDQITSNIVSIDKNFVFKMLENVLNNAFRFAKERIVLRISESEDKIEFVVEDDGIGFGEAELKKYGSNLCEVNEPKTQQNVEKLVFGNTNQTPLFSNKGTFGIGLSICKILCEKQGGQLKLKNNLSGGAYVMMWIKKDG